MALSGSADRRDKLHRDVRGLAILDGSRDAELPRAHMASGNQFPHSTASRVIATLGFEAAGIGQRKRA